MGAKLLPLEIYLIRMRGKEHKKVSLGCFFCAVLPREGFMKDKGAVPQLECWLELCETRRAVLTEESQLLAGSGDHGRPQRELF